MRENIISKFEDVIGKDRVLVEEPMKKHTTFRLGGAADYFLSPEKAEQVAELIHICREENISYFILGNGSNLLVSDRGYRGTVIQIFKNMNDIRVEGTKLYVQAGALLSAIARKALDAGLTGMEFASGIPGTVGGAAVMNAGAYGGEMKDIIKSEAYGRTEGTKSHKAAVGVCQCRKYI